MTITRDGPATRKAIVAEVECARAIHKSELCRRVDRAWGTVGYHLRILKKEGRVTMSTRGGRVWIFPSRLMRWERLEAQVLAENSIHEVLAAVQEVPWTTVGNLEGLVALPAKTIRRHLSQLTATGLIEKRGERPQQFRVSERSDRHD